MDDDFCVSDAPKTRKHKKVNLIGNKLHKIQKNSREYRSYGVDWEDPEEDEPSRDTWSSEGYPSAIKILPAQKFPDDIPVSSKLQVERKYFGKKEVTQLQKIGGYTVKKTDLGESTFHDHEYEMKLLDVPLDSRVLFVSDREDDAIDLSRDYVPMSQGGRNYGVYPDTFDELLQYILAHRDQFKSSNPRTPINVDFVTMRGTFARIMQMPYETQEDALIQVTLYKGTIYAISKATERKLEDVRTAEEWDNKLSFAGLRFEEYVAVPVFPEQAEDVAYGSHNEHYSVVKSQIGNHTMTYSAEMDCIRPGVDPEDVKANDFIELKTHRPMTKDWQVKKWREHKTNKWWCQSYLIGTPKILCGYRCKDLIVRKLEFWTLDELKNESSGFWSYKVCLNFLNEFLNHLKSVVTEDNPQCVYKFYWNPPSCQDVKQNGTITCTKTYSDEFRILPQWFVDNV